MKFGSIIFIFFLSGLFRAAPGQVTSDLKILTIGDSNGASPDGWPEQLKKLLPGSLIINKSVSGNTIGFDNLQRESLNTVKNITDYLNEGNSEAGDLDFILICLGTNDAKRIFISQQEQVPENLRSLFNLIKNWLSERHTKMPHICFITPPPMDETKIDKEKYGGGDERIRRNNQKFKKIARECNVDFLQTYNKLKKNFRDWTTDGVHLTAEAHMETAKMVANYIHIQNHHQK